MSASGLGFRAYGGNRAPKAPFVLNKDSPQAQGLRSWWVTNETSGAVNGTVRDLGPDRRDLTNIATYGISNMLGSRAGDFQLSDQVAGVTSSPFSVLPATGATLAVWTNPNGVSTGVMFGIRRSPVSAFDAIYLDLNGSNTRAISADGNVFDSANNTLLTVGETAHVAGVFASPTSRTCYVNGIGGTPQTDNNNPEAMDSVGIAGMLRQGTWQNEYSGIVLEARIWDRALSDTEIWELYSPYTKWDLYYELNRRTIYLPLTTGVAVVAAYRLLTRTFTRPFVREMTRLQPTE